MPNIFGTALVPSDALREPTKDFSAPTAFLLADGTGVVGKAVLLGGEVAWGRGGTGAGIGVLPPPLSVRVRLGCGILLLTLDGANAAGPPVLLVLPDRSL